MSRPARSRRSAPPPQPPSRDAAVLAMTRLAILFAVLALGAAGWLRHRGAAAMDPRDFRMLGHMVTGAWVFSAVAVLILRLRWQRATGAAEKRRLSILAWALGEVPAVAGGLSLWVTGDPRRYFAGLIWLLFTFLLFSTPARRR
jgi:hypothetical protein